MHEKGSWGEKVPRYLTLTTGLIISPLFSPLPPNLSLSVSLSHFLSFTSLVFLQYIYADLPVGKEVGALCIIFSQFFSFLFDFSSTHSLARCRSDHSLDFYIRCIVYHSSSITQIRSGRLSSSTRIDLRRTSFARGSELSSEIAIRMDFFLGRSFFISYF